MNCVPTFVGKVLYGSVGGGRGRLPPALPSAAIRPRPRYPRPVPGLAFLAVLLAFTLLQVSPLSAQSRTVNKVARVEVPVFEDNLDDAKNRAIRKGRIAALRGMLRDLVEEEWVVLFDKELRNRILNRGQRYIESFRVQKLETSPDRTRYTAVVSVQIVRSTLVEDLRELSLPLKGAKPAPLTFFYARNDPVMGHGKLREEISARLRKRLRMLNFQAGSPVALEEGPAALLTNPLEAFNERIRLLKRHQNRPALFVRFDPVPPPESTPEGVAHPSRKPSSRGRIFLYQRGSGALMANIEQEARGLNVSRVRRSPKARESLYSSLLAPLILQLQPGAIRRVMTATQGGALLRMRVIGFQSAADQELFEAAFFKRNTPFAKFRLHMLSRSGVTYQGKFNGDRSTLEREWNGRKIGEFRVRRVNWFNDLLEIDVSRKERVLHAAMRLFPPEKRPIGVANQLARFFGKYPKLDVEDPTYEEVEDNGWLNRANRLPFDTTIYARIEDRSDKDLFVGEALDSGERVTLIWQRSSQSKLSPAVRVYDAAGTLLHTFHPKTWLRYIYTLPKGQHRFFMEVSDRFGYLKVDTGGYLNFHYLFKVEREKKGK